MYLIGPISYLKAEFPDHDFSHARTNIQGDEVVIERVISVDQQDSLEAEGVLCLDHQDALDYLNDPDMEGTWFIEEGGQQ